MLDPGRVDNSGWIFLREARTKAQVSYLAGAVYSTCRVDLSRYPGQGRYTPVTVPPSPALCGPAARCADMLDAAPATVLPTPRTFSSAGPSATIGTTLRCCTALDQSKTDVSNTPRRSARSSAEDSTPYRSRHTTHWRHRTPAHSTHG